MNEDGNLDVIVGNYGQANQYVQGNGDGTFDIAIDLTGGSRNTNAIAV